MNIHTLTIVVPASRDTVFNFLADIENLPKWAGGYYERLTLERGRWCSLTADGEQVVDMKTSAGTGVIDLRAGPLPESMTLMPIRVLSLSVGSTLASFTFIEAAAATPDFFQRRSQILQAAVKKLPARFGGGKLHLSESIPQLMELGLN